MMKSTGFVLALPATADWGYLRLRRQDYSKDDLQRWIGRVRSETWAETYVFFKHEDEARGPEMARQFVELAGGDPPNH